jgi:nuclear pore complex protein Nup98-Nup96
LNSNQQNKTFGFGAPSTPATTTAGAFGTFTGTSNQPTGGFNLGGLNTTAANTLNSSNPLSAPPTAPTTGLFGQTNLTQANPAPLPAFGQPQTSTSAFGGFGAKPTLGTAGATGTMQSTFSGFGGGNTFGQTAPSTGLFGATPSMTNTGFGGSAFGAQASGTTGFGGMQVGGMNQMQQSLSATVDSKPWGSTPLFDNVPEAVIKKVDSNPSTASIGSYSSQNGTERKSPMASSLVKTAPMAVTRNKLRVAGFHQTSTFSKSQHGYFATSGANQQIQGSSTLKSLNGNQPGAPSVILPPHSFTPRSSVKKLEVRASTNGSGDGYLSSSHRPTSSYFAESEFGSGGAGLETPSKPPKSNTTFLNGRSNVNSTPGLTPLPKPSSSLPLGPYMMSPTPSAIRSMTDKELMQVRNLSITHPDFGSITFLEAVDLRGISPEELCGGLVTIEYGEIAVYPDLSKKPSHGNGLNVRSRMTLRGMWPKSKVDKKPIRDPGSMAMETYIKRLKSLPGTIFETYDPNDGVWTFTAND